MVRPRNNRNLQLGLAILPVLAVCAWTGLVLVGFTVLARYANTPSQAVSPPVAIASLPIGLTVPVGDERWTLIMAVHPRCPCTQAAISELERLIPHIGGETNIQVLVYRPRTEDKHWSKTVMVRRLGDIPQVELVDDPDGYRSQELGIYTSGGVVLANPRGQLRFAGGITVARGHEGLNDGASAICNWVSGQGHPLSRTPVYGCPLAAKGGTK